MNLQLSLPVRAFLYVVGPQIVNIAKDIIIKNINAENLAEIRTKLYQVVKSITGRTAFTWDDELGVQLLDIFTSHEAIAKWGALILDPIEAWIKASETHWDDELLEPIIKAFRDISGIPAAAEK